MTHKITVPKDYFKESASSLNEEFMEVSSIKNGEVIGTSKIYYKDLVKVKETENYLFLYPNKTQAFAISKKISTEELSLLKVWVHSSKVK